MYLHFQNTIDSIAIEEYEFEVIDVISILPVNKAVGPDCMS
jgi:hypothetical protein